MSPKSFRAPWLRRGLLALLALVVVSLAGPTWADHEAAKQLFRAGRAAYERGDYRAAAASFEQAARSEPHAQAWYAAGDAWASASVADRAVYAFEQALALGGLPAHQRNRVEHRAAALAKQLGVVAIDGPAGTIVSVGHVSRVELPARIHLRQGEHQVRLVEPAHAAQTKVAHVVAGETASVVFDYPSPPVEPSSKPSPPEPTPLPPERAPAPDEEHVAAGSQVAAWVLVGLGASTAVVAGVVTAVGLDARDEWEADRRDTELYDQAETLRTTTGVTWVAAGVLLGAGVTLLIVDAATRDEPGPELALRLGMGGAALTGRW